MNLTFTLTERNRKAWEKLREEGGKSSVVERQNKAERCRETDGDTVQREVRERLREGGRKRHRKSGEEKYREDIFRGRERVLASQLEA